MSKSPIELAIQTQLDIQAQLKAEIARLENPEAQAPQQGTSVLRFYNSALHKVIADTAAINTDVIRYETRFIPDTKNKLAHLREKGKFMQEHLENIQKVENATNFEGEVTAEKAQQLIETLKAQISVYDSLITSKSQKIEKLRAELRSLLEKNQRDRGVMARLVWQDEVTSEQGLMKKVPGRRQSITAFGNGNVQQMRVLQGMSRRYSESGGMFRARVQNLLKQSE